MTIFNLIEIGFPPRLRRVIFLAWLIFTFLFLYEGYIVSFEFLSIQELIVNAGIIFGFYFFLEFTIHFVFGIIYWIIVFSIFINPYMSKAPHVPDYGDFVKSEEPIVKRFLLYLNDSLIVRDTRNITKSLLFKFYKFLSRILEVIIIFLSFILYSKNLAHIFSIIGISIAIILYIFGLFLTDE